MTLLYHKIAGQSVARLEALSDGIFAVAMTLLIFNLNVPQRLTGVQDTARLLWSRNGFQADGQLLRAIGHLGQPVLAYFLSFLTLGLFWIGQQAQLHYTRASDRHLTWLHIAFIFAVTLVPATTGLLANFMGVWTALVVYWVNLVLLGGLLLAIGRYAERAGLLKEDCPDGMRAAAERRIVVNQVLYAVAVLLGTINSYIGVIAIFALHLNSALAPPVPPFNRF
jgi:uncharacterized membrane protein